MSVKILVGDVRAQLRALPDESVHCMITSPPYWGLRDYGVAGQIGMEQTLGEHLRIMVEIFREVRRVLRKDGTVWLNYGDCYATSANGRSAADTKAAGNDDRTFRDKPFSTVGGTLKPKDLAMISNRLAIALQDDGWWVRSEIIWDKANPMPESIMDRPTCAHEKIWLLAKAERYFFDAVAIAEPIEERSSGNKQRKFGDDHDRPGHAVGSSIPWEGNTRNKRNVWHIVTEPFTGWTRTSRQVRVESDASVDGKKRTTSLSCPKHGDHLSLASMAFCDERADDHAARSGDTETDRVEAPRADCAPSSSPLAHQSSQQSSDFDLRENVPSATARSSGTHRTAHDPATNSACTVSAQIHNRTADSEALPAPFDSAEHMPENNISADDLVEDRAVQTRDGIDSTSCTCEWYVEITEETSHFATMPTALVEPCILAGTSAHGVCTSCGAPWKRTVDKPFVGDNSKKKVLYGEGVVIGSGSRTKTGGHPVSQAQTTGWEPCCKCEDNTPVPATVCDIFGGSGTVGLVADRLGRNAILVELSVDYANMAHRRITGAQRQGDLLRPGFFSDVEISK